MHLLHIAIVASLHLPGIDVKRCWGGWKVGSVFSMPGTITLILSILIKPLISSNTSIIHPTGDLPSLVSRCNHCLFSFNLFYPPIQSLLSSCRTCSLLQYTLIPSPHWRLTFSCHEVQSVVSSIHFYPLIHPTPWATCLSTRCNHSYCPFSSLITSSIFLYTCPTGDLPSVVTRCNHFHCSFSSRITSSLIHLPPQWPGCYLRLARFPETQAIVSHTRIPRVKNGL